MFEVRLNILNTSTLNVPLSYGIFKVKSLPYMSSKFWNLETLFPEINVQLDLGH
jgi:hypothetical protein